MRFLNDAIKPSLKKQGEEPVPKSPLQGGKVETEKVEFKTDVQ